MFFFPLLAWEIQNSFDDERHGNYLINYVPSDHHENRTE